jgi:hypothetical protein
MEGLLWRLDEVRESSKEVIRCETYLCEVCEVGAMGCNRHMATR